MKMYDYRVNRSHVKPPSQSKRYHQIVEWDESSMTYLTFSDMPGTRVGYGDDKDVRSVSSTLLVLRHTCMKT